MKPNAKYKYREFIARIEGGKPKTPSHLGRLLNNGFRAGQKIRAKERLGNITAIVADQEHDDPTRFFMCDCYVNGQLFPHCTWDHTAHFESAED